MKSSGYAIPCGHSWWRWYRGIQLLLEDRFAVIPVCIWWWNMGVVNQNRTVGRQRRGKLNWDVKGEEGWDESREWGGGGGEDGMGKHQRRDRKIENVRFLSLDGAIAQSFFWQINTVDENYTWDVATSCWWPVGQLPGGSQGRAVWWCDESLDRSASSTCRKLRKMMRTPRAMDRDF